jgi:hypothetical protein
MLPGFHKIMKIAKWTGVKALVEYVGARQFGQDLSFEFLVFRYNQASRRLAKRLLKNLASGFGRKSRREP